MKLASLIVINSDDKEKAIKAIHNQCRKKGIHYPKGQYGRYIQCSLYEGTKHSSSSQLATAHKDLSSVRHYAKIDLSARRNALDKKLKVGNE